MDLTKNDFQTWLANPVTQVFRAWAGEKAEDLVYMIARQIVKDGLPIPAEYQQQIMGQAAVWKEISELQFEGMDINEQEMHDDGDDGE